MRHSNVMVQTQSLNPTMERKWNKKLSGKFALAPIQWQEQIEYQIREGLMTEREATEHYKYYCDEYSKWCSDYVVNELRSMDSDFGKHALAYGCVTIFGIGIGRGLEFIPTANQMQMQTHLYDISDVAIKFAHKKFREMGVNGMNATHKQEIKGEEEEFNMQDTMLLQMFNFLQILPRERMVAVGKSVGKWLALSKRRAVIVHPSEKGNEAAKWGDTTPYTKAELLAPIAEGLQGPAQIIREGAETDYFRCHKYSIFTISG